MLNVGIQSSISTAPGRSLCEAGRREGEMYMRRGSHRHDACVHMEHRICDCGLSRRMESWHDHLHKMLAAGAGSGYVGRDVKVRRRDSCDEGMRKVGRVEVERVPRLLHW